MSAVCRTRPGLSDRCGRPLLDRNESRRRTDGSRRPVDADGGRRTLATVGFATRAGGSSGGSTERVSGRSIGGARRDRVGLIRASYHHPGRGHCGNASLAEDVRGRFDLVGLVHGCRRIGVDIDGRKADGRVDRGGCARFRRRRGRAEIFRCARRSCRELVGRHLRRRILVIRRDWSRGCNRWRRGGRRYR